MEGAGKIQSTLSSIRAGTSRRSQAADAASGTDAFMKLLQEKQDAVPQPQTQQAENGKPVDEKAQETGESKEDVSDDREEEVSPSEGTVGQEALQQAVLQQQAAQMITVTVEPEARVGQLSAGVVEEAVAKVADVEQAVEKPEIQTTGKPEIREAGNEEGPKAEDILEQQVQTADGQEDAAGESKVAINVAVPQTQSTADENAHGRTENGKQESGEIPRTVRDGRTAGASRDEGTERASRTEKDEGTTGTSGTERDEGIIGTSRTEKDEGIIGTSRTEKDEGTAGTSRDERTVETPEGQDTVQEAAYGAEDLQKAVREETTEVHTERTAADVPLKTSEQTLPEDLGNTLAARLSETGRTLTVELEPASLGKLTIRLIYEGDRAAVSIIANNPRTLEILNQKASEIAAILEEKTGQETVIFTQPAQQEQDQPEGQGHQGQGSQEDREERGQGREEEKHRTDSFAQQLRLGLI